jgi:hypothetical protein
MNGTLLLVIEQMNDIQFLKYSIKLLKYYSKNLRFFLHLLSRHDLQPYFEDAKALADLLSSMGNEMLMVLGVIHVECQLTDYHCMLTFHQSSKTKRKSPLEKWIDLRLTLML